jgi:hypothetical protein
MVFVRFDKIFPRIALREIGTLIIAEDPYLPPGNYSFIEWYCPNPHCDCRTVRITVAEGIQCHAELCYGWHDPLYYRGPFGNYPDNGYPGPSCAIGAAQGPFAEIFLERFTTNLLSDTGYINHLQRHYAMIKAEAENRDLADILIENHMKKIRRNAACICGSGKKYKKCCQLISEKASK